MTPTNLAYWGLKGGLLTLRASAAVLGIWTYAKANGLQDELLEGVRTLPNLVRDLFLLLLPGGGR